MANRLKLECWESDPNHTHILSLKGDSSLKTETLSTTLCCMFVVKRGKHSCMINIFKNAIMSYHVMVYHSHGGRPPDLKLRGSMAGVCAVSKHSGWTLRWSWKKICNKFPDIEIPFFWPLKMDLFGILQCLFHWNDHLPFGVDIHHHLRKQLNVCWVMKPKLNC